MLETRLLRGQSKTWRDKRARRDSL